MDLLYRVKTLWAALRGNHYTWPAIDITLPGNRHFHLIGSIHMGSHDMAPHFAAVHSATSSSLHDALPIWLPCPPVCSKSSKTPMR